MSPGTDCKLVYYRAQTKFAKVMFSQVSICPGGGLRGGACVAGVAWRGRGRAWRGGHA